MSATVAVKTQAKEATRVEIEAGRPLDVQAQLAMAVEALSAIAGENDFTCMRALFRMRRRAEEALEHIGAGRRAYPAPH